MPNEDKPAVNIPTDDSPAPLTDQLRFETIFGQFPSVSAAPTDVPKNAQNQVRVYKSGSDVRLYFYDTANAAWSYVSPITIGGSDKNVQYNNNGSLGGVANNTTSTKKYLQQVSTGTPSFEQVNGADLLMTDITTNDVSTSQHGFAPKGDGSTDKFLNANAAYSTPTPIKGSTTTYDLTTASGTQTIAHGLGKTPRFIQLIITSPGPGNQTSSSYGGYDGSANHCGWAWTSVGIGATVGGNSTSVGAHVVGHNTLISNYQEAVITADGTNITLTWTKTGSPTGTAYIQWLVLG